MSGFGGDQTFLHALWSFSNCFVIAENIVTGNGIDMACSRPQLKQNNVLLRNPVCPGFFFFFVAVSIFVRIGGG